VILFLFTCGIILGSLWAAGALFYDFPLPGLRLPLAITYIILTTAFLTAIRNRRKSMLLCLAAFAAVLGWWLTIAPSNQRPWQPDVARNPWAEIDGDHVTIHNLRNCDYVTEMNYSCRWETKSVDVSQIRGMDLFVTYWGSPWIAHPIVSFHFADGAYIPMSIETRKEVGESYSAIRGFFRQYELLYIISDERDVVRLRTNYRDGEYVYAYRTMTKPEDARTIFLYYLARANSLRDKPEWYNALTSNCTTNITSLLAAKKIGGMRRWDWRILLNGKGDEMVYEAGDLAGNLPFAELKQRALINSAAQAADRDPDFSRRIREGRPGFN
jgi:hypothetical protein